MSIWDDPALQAPPEPAYIRLDSIGDGFDGRVVTVTRETFDDGSIAPQITFLDDADGEQKFYTAGQTDAKRKLADLRPETGDHISVRLVGYSGKFKHIDIKVNNRGGAQHAVAAQMPPTHQPPTAVGQSYQTAAPPVYATNSGTVASATAPQPGPGGTVASATAGAPPPGVEQTVWDRMDEPQRALMRSVLGQVPAF